MAHFTFRNALSFLLQRRCLSTSKISLREITKDSNFALHFLTNSCGLPLNAAMAVSSKFQITEKKEKELHCAIDYLKGEGFTPSQIAKVIQKYPKMLHSNIETTLKPKLEFLKQNGFVGEILTEFISSNPFIIKASLGSQLKPSLDLLRHYVKSDDKILQRPRQFSWFLTHSFGKITQPNIDFLVKEAVPYSSIAKIITRQPRAIQIQHCRTVNAFNAVKNMGIQPDSPMFAQAFVVMVSMSESTVKKKMEFLKSFGWTEEEILTAFKKFPSILTCSEDKIRKSVGFYQNSMRLDLQTIMRCPVLFGLAINTRVRPRYAILKMLESKKLIKEDSHRLSLQWLYQSEEKFLDKFVNKYHDSIPELLTVYRAKKRDEKVGS